MRRVRITGAELDIEGRTGVVRGFGTRFDLETGSVQQTLIIKLDTPVERESRAVRVVTVPAQTAVAEA